MSPSEVFQRARKIFLVTGNREMATFMALLQHQRTRALGASSLQAAIRIMTEDLPEGMDYETASEGLPPLS